MNIQVLCCDRCNTFLQACSTLLLREGLKIAEVRAQHPLIYRCVTEDGSCPGCHVELIEPKQVPT